MVRYSKISLGQSGEELAVRYLRKQGYTIIKQNYRLRIGEIDIIARDGHCLVFVEVKTRHGTQCGTGFEAVDERKQHQIARVALSYLSHHHIEDTEVRFDVVSVQVQKGKAAIELLKNAFEYYW